MFGEEQKPMNSADLLILVQDIHAKIKFTDEAVVKFLNYCETHEVPGELIGLGMGISVTQRSSVKILEVIAGGLAATGMAEALSKLLFPDQNPN